MRCKVYTYTTKARQAASFEKETQKMLDDTYHNELKKEAGGYYFAEELASAQVRFHADGNPFHLIVFIKSK